MLTSSGILSFKYLQAFVRNVCLTQNHHLQPLRFHLLGLRCPSAATTPGVSIPHVHFRADELDLIRESQSQAFHSDPHDLFLFFQPPQLSPRRYVWPEQRTDWRETESDGWKHRAYMQQCDEACSLHICFHFGVCFQLGAREYGAPKCEVGCFHVVIWRTLPFLICIDLFPIFCSHRHFKSEAIFPLQLCSRPGGEPLW